MANRQRAPQEVANHHNPLIQESVRELEVKRAHAWEAELEMRERICDAFDDGMTVGQIKVATITEAMPEGYSTPRLYQIKKERLEEATA